MPNIDLTDDEAILLSLAYDLFYMEHPEGFPERFVATARMLRSMLIAQQKTVGPDAGAALIDKLHAVVSPDRMLELRRQADPIDVFDTIVPFDRPDGG